MATDKKSFLFYCDWIDSIEILSDDQAGKLIKHVLRYVNDQDPEIDDPFVKLAFAPIRAALKRDLEKYESKREKNRENALKRWGKKEPGGEPMRSDAKDADSGIVIDNDNAKVKGILIRKQEFTNLILSEYGSVYGLELCDSFVDYWSEAGPKDKKMRFEKQTSFDPKRRLKTWNTNAKKFKDEKSGKTTQGSGAGSERQDF